MPAREPPGPDDPPSGLIPYPILPLTTSYAMSNAVCRLSLLAAVLAPVAGCGDGLKRQGVSGTVSYKGKAIVKGTVTFAPTQPGGATQVTAAIEDGQFSIPQDKGLVPGKYVLRFEAIDKVLYGAAVPGEPAPPPKDLGQAKLPAKYGVDSKYEVEVTSGRENVFDVKLD
ncbi:MAG: hypothetical protein JWO38_1596 [Gemmataceae bacterium]|nr:hypothetical protein [Gemmataceae bacterium]